MPIDASQVHVYDDGTLLGSATVNGSGAWSMTQTLAAGDHPIHSKAEDAAGNISSQVMKNIKTGCTKKTSTPDLLDDSGSSSTDNITNDSTPRISFNIDMSDQKPTGFTGTVPSATVASLKLYEKVGASYNLIETLTPDVLGNLFYKTFTIASALSDGNHQYAGAWVDALGNESAKSNLLTVTVDTTAPNAPSVTSIADGQIFVGTSIGISGSAS